MQRRQVGKIIISKVSKINIQVYGTDILNYMKMIKSISTTLTILIIAYLVCLLPVIAFTWGYWPAKTENSSYETKAIFASM